MNKSLTRNFPRKRQRGLIVEDLSDEVLIYDLDRDKAHCLNHTAALVWRQCDGRTGVKAIANRVQSELNACLSEEMVWSAIKQFGTLHLLEHRLSLPPQIVNVTRRKMMRDLGIGAALAVPLVTSIVSPTAVQAKSCKDPPAACSGITECCPPSTCINGHCQ